MTIDGRKVIMLGSNNYLGLANHPLVIEAAANALAKYGTSCSGSRLLNGTIDIHVEIEERIASFMQRDAALVFSTGFQVNQGVLSCLLGRQDLVFLDSLDHASLIEGARLGFAKVFKYKHNDLSDLAAKLARAPSEKGKLIAVDGVFSASPTPASMAAALAALEIGEAEPFRREKLWGNTRYMKIELQLLGFEIGNSNSPIIPIVIGDDMTTFVMVKRLQEEGVFANPVISPAVPPGGAMIRTSYMATHEREHLDKALDSLKKVAREVGVL